MDKKDIMKVMSHFSWHFKFAMDKAECWEDAMKEAIDKTIDSKELLKGQVPPPESETNRGEGEEAMCDKCDPEYCKICGTIEHCPHCLKTRRYCPKASESKPSGRGQGGRETGD